VAILFSSTALQHFDRVADEKALGTPQTRDARRARTQLAFLGAAAQELAKSAKAAQQAMEKPAARIENLRETVDGLSRDGYALPVEAVDPALAARLCFRATRACAKRSCPSRQTTRAPTRRRPRPANQLELDHGDAAPPRRKRWAWLLAHVFADLDTCPRCSGPMRWVQAATNREAACEQLERLGRAPRPLPAQPFTPRGQLSLPFMG
jgi:hypothetical protein